MSWYGDALGDADGDGVLNFYDSYPYDSTNGSYNPNPDSDGDGIPDANDPEPNDPTNYSSYNDTCWYGDALGDSDNDNTQNFYDSYPYDPYNGNPPPDTNPNPDSDGDGIPDSSDPAPGDASNTSPINGVSWYGNIWGDDDGDGVQNFWDSQPYGEPQVDSDGDGLLDNVDPSPFDSGNYSPFNNTSWLSDALGDADGDGIANFFDEWPYDRFNGTDDDGDGIPNSSDPAPADSMNYSPHNGRNWYGDEVLGDMDNDGILNFFDVYPEDMYNGNPPVYDNNGGGNGGGGGGPIPVDEDEDGISDDVDPVLGSKANYSILNDRSWFGDALGDADLDGIPNFYDETPFGDGEEGDPEGPPSGPVISIDGPSFSVGPVVLLNNNYDEIGVESPPGVTPPSDMSTESLIIRGGPHDGQAATDDLTRISLSMPLEYVENGGEVVFTKIGGSGDIRIHALLIADNGEYESRPINFDEAYVQPQDDLWEYWAEGTAVGPVTLRVSFSRVDVIDANGDTHVLGGVPIDVEITVCEASLSVDQNRDLAIDSHSSDNLVNRATPFRFWVNDDSDTGEAGDSGNTDIPGSANSTRMNNNVIDGSRDLVDFFPVCLDIKQLLDRFPPDSTTRYVLKHSEGALNFAYTNLDRVHAFDYLKKVLETGFGPNFSQPAREATTAQITSAGVALNADFLNGIRFVGSGVILIEARSATEQPLKLVVEKSGMVVAELYLDVKISPVEQMYRHVNMTGFAKEYNGSPVASPSAPRPTETDEPAGLPDSRCSQKYFVFVHGYNVSAQKARGWNAEVFKRLYALGSKARFVGVTWNGDTGLDYHKAVFQAFQAGDELKQCLDLFVGPGADVTVAAHSLGNMVVSHAIQSAWFSPARYFMINAAVPREAYDSSVLVPTGEGSESYRMTEAHWKSRETRLFASNWHKLFRSEGAADGDLTPKLGRF